MTTCSPTTSPTGCRSGGGGGPAGSAAPPAFEIQGLDDRLLSAFSTRSGDIDTALRTAVADFTAAHARPPSRVEMVKLRQQATLATRPPKTPHPLQDLLARWADRARRVTGRDPAAITADALRARPGTVLRHDQVSPATVDRLGALVVDGLLERRSTWTVWNARAEAARATRGLRMASAGDRVALLDRVTTAALARSESFEPVDPVPVVEGFTRPDGTSVFTRPDEHRYTDPRLLAAETRLLQAHATLGAPTVPEHIARRLATTPQPPARRGDRPVRLAEDQVHAVLADLHLRADGRRARRPGRHRQDHHPDRDPGRLGDRPRPRHGGRPRALRDRRRRARHGAVHPV